MAVRPRTISVAPTPRRPVWLDQPAVRGNVQRLDVRALGRDLAIEVWSSGEGRLPLLVAHDGPEYDERADLTRYVGAMIARGELPPCRVALLPPGNRDEWYSASAVYGRALSSHILHALHEEAGVSGRPVGMGASLGAVAMLQAQRRWPGSFDGLFLQSGSFFFSRFDRHESAFPRYGRVVRFVRAVLRASSHPDPLLPANPPIYRGKVGGTVPVVMTCGAEEENVHNNRLMVAALRAQGYDAYLHELPGSHDWAGWRDALDPHLTRLLSRLWWPR